MAAQTAPAGAITSLLLLTGDGQPFKGPEGVALGPAGDIYVMDAGNSRIVKFDSAGQPLLAWGSRGSEDGQFLEISENTGYLAVDAQGNVYVADTNNQRIQKFDANGKFLAKWTAPAWVTDDKTYPVYITATADGFIYALVYSDNTTPVVQKYDAQGKFLLQWGDQGSLKFNSPLAITSDSQGHVYVSELTGIIYTFDDFGTLDSKFSLSPVNNVVTTPTGLARDTVGNFYITDGPNNRAIKVDATGKLLAAWGSQGTAPGQLFRPYGITVGADDKIYIVEHVNNRLQIFGQGG
jgi:DNA-binding beta-propeller fold protein YncE